MPMNITDNNSGKLANSKVTFPQMGNYTPALKVLFEKLGLKVIPPEKTNKKTIEDGAKLSPEMFCFPFKVNVGNYLSAFEKGADTIFMWENIGGICRFRYYWITQEKILRDAGFDIRVFNLNTKNFISRIREIKKETKISFFQILSALFLLLREIKFIEKLEKRVCYLRPREKNFGQADTIFTEALEGLNKIKTGKELSKLQKEIWQKFLEVEIDRNKKVLKVGLIGEFYTVIDPVVNFEIEKKLGRMEVESFREMTLSYFLKHGILPWKDWLIQRKTRPYLKSTVGGHGQDAIYEMLNCAEKGFDGVIHLLPFGCMPEVSVRPILQKIHQETGIPFLSLSLDEQVAEAGINTRIEAFVDVVKNYHENKKH